MLSFVRDDGVASNFKQIFLMEYYINNSKGHMTVTVHNSFMQVA